MICKFCKSTNSNSIMPTSEFDDIIGITRTCLRLTGVWPRSKQNIHLSIRAFLCAFILVFFISIPQTTKLLFVKNNLNDIIEILIVADFIIAISLFKLFSEWYYKEGY